MENSNSNKFPAKWILVGIILGILIGFSLSAITPRGETDYTSSEDALKLQIDQKELEINSLESQVETLQSQITVLKSQVPPLPPSSGETGSSRFFPVEIGKPLTYTFTDVFTGGEITATVTVTEIIRGQSAWELIFARNQFNDPPLQNCEYILVKINFQYLSGSTIDTTFSLSEQNFGIVSSEGVEYEFPIGVVDPEPDIDRTLYPGATHEGWATYMVYEDDTEPLLVYGRDFFKTGGIWFKLYE